MSKKDHSREDMDSKIEKMGLWMIRSGEGGYLAKEFVEGQFVALGWDNVGDLTTANNREAIQSLVQKAFPDSKKG